MVEQIKFCKDCRHITQNPAGLCSHPEQPIFDLVNGDLTPCAIARLDPSKSPSVNLNSCGPAAKWFEPKNGD